MLHAATNYQVLHAGDARRNTHAAALLQRRRRALGATISSHYHYYPSTPGYYLELKKCY